MFLFLLFAVFILGRLTSSEAERQAVTDFVLQLLPDQVDLVASQLEAIGSASLGLGIAGSVVIIWASLGVFRVTSQAVNHAWGIEERPGFWRHQIVAFGMLLGAGGLLLLAHVWVSVAEMVRSSWFTRVIEVIPALDVIKDLQSSSPVAIVLVVVIVAVHYFVPATSVRLRDVWPGAVLTAVLWFAALSGFSWYLAEMVNVSIHGSITTVVTFLFWVYISAAIFLYGVEFTAVWLRLRAKGYA